MSSNSFTRGERRSSRRAGVDLDRAEFARARVEADRLEPEPVQGEVAADREEHGVARRLEQTSGDELAMNEGTIYASLVRLEQRRLIKTSWGTSENNRRAKYYSLTKLGRKQLAREAEDWMRLVDVMGRLLNSEGA